MAAQYKMALMVALLGCARAGRDTRDDNKSDDMEREEISRRSWQYEGMPIHHARRHAEEDTERSRNPKPTHAWLLTVSPEMVPTTTTAAKEVPPQPVLPPLNKRYRRIYNADETASIGEHPYLAAVLLNNELWCGGAIIGPDLVFTAAHCLQLQYNNRFFREYVKMLTVRVGSDNATAGGEHLRVDEIFFHPNYKPQTLEFNYAVLRLHKNITFGPDVAQIEYSKRHDVTIDKTVTFLGWGSVLGVGERGGTVLLQKVDLPVYDKADCTEVYGRDLVTYSTFCAGYISKMKNVCNHDAGGPAIMDGQLIGLLSFSSKRCDEADKPAVFSSTGAAAEWLDSIPEIRRKSEELQRAWMKDAQ